MATTMRSLDTRFWIDGFVRKLNALDRYVFLYFLTSPHSSWCGVYEVDLGMVAFETGIEENELVNVIIPRLAPKVIYVDGWVYVKNWSKYHLSGSGTISPQQKKGMDEAWKTVPERIQRRIKEIEGKEIPYAYPIGGVSPSASASASALLGDSEESQLKNNDKDMAGFGYTDEPDLPTIGDDGEIEKTEEARKKEQNQKVTEIIEWAEKVRKKNFIDITTQRKMIHDMRKAKISPDVIKTTYLELVHSEYWQKQDRLPDFKTVFSSLKNKK
jgi:hypothetical protein